MASELYKVCQDASYDTYFRNYFALDGADEIIVECLVPLCLICSGLNIYFFCRFPNAREPPFDILLIITLLSILNSSVYTSTVGKKINKYTVYNKIYPITAGSQEVPDSYQSFCSVTGTMHFICQLGVTVYNTIFCLYYTCKIKNPLKVLQLGYEIINKYMRCALFFLLLALLLSMLVIKLGSLFLVLLSIYLGICGLKVAKSSVFVELAILFIYLAVLITTSVFFLKYLNRVGKFDAKAKMFFKYYLLYTLLISIVYVLQCSVMIFIIVDCFTGISQSTYSIFAKTGNILVLINPIISTIIITFHPQFGQKFIPQIFKLCLQKKPNPNRSTFYDNLLTTSSRRSLDNSFMIQLPEMSTQNKGYLSSIKQFNRLSLLSTVLGCISLTSSRRPSKSNEKKGKIRYRGSQSQEYIFSWNFSDEERVKIDEEIVGENKDYFVQNVPAAMIDFVSHSTTLFDFLKDQDGLDFVEYSTNPNRNLQKIYKNASADGGSSGQFFFFTHDNRILLKTITSAELEVLQQRLQSYYYHFIHNPDSLIVKIYGVYSVVNPQSGQQIHFMMMGNLCEDINKKYVMRIYDCKGSSHHREVFKEGKEQQEPQYSKKTMKDVDFDRLENKVWVKKEVSQRIKSTLKSDSAYFEQNGLIDYSLIIIKVDYNAYCLDMQGRKPSFNQRTMFINQKQPNMIYILGIIDYLETWNARKKGERWYKSLFARKETISSQSPAFYSQRFCQNLIQKIFK